MKMRTDGSLSFSQRLAPPEPACRWRSLQSSSSRSPPQRVQPQSSVNLIGRTEPPFCTFPKEIGGNQVTEQSAVGAGVSLTVKVIDLEPLRLPLVALATKV